MFGGISPAEIAVVYVLLAAWAMLFACVGVWGSSLFKRSPVAALFASGSCLGYLLLTYVLGEVSQMSMTFGGSDHSILDALNPGWAAGAALASAKVCGVSLPISLVAVVLHAAIGVLALVAASTHVRYHRVERALPIRLLLLGITAVVIWLLVGNATSFHSISNRTMLDYIGNCGTTILLIVAVAASVFATGEVKRSPNESTASYALSARSAFKSDLGGAMSFLLLWTAVAYGVFGGTLLWASKAQGVTLDASSWATYAKAGAAILAIVAGVSAVGVLASSLCTLRRNAVALVILFVLGMFGLYPVIMSYYEPGISNSRGLVWQLAAFWAVMPIFAATGGMPPSSPQFWWTTADSWLVTCVAYVFVAMAALGIASAAAPRFGGVKEEQF